MGRSENILGRVRRNLSNAKMLHTKIEDTFIYDEMQNAQNDIIVRFGKETSFNITLVDGTSDYSLVISSEKIIKGIKEIIFPTTWTDVSDYTIERKIGIEFVENNIWNEIIKTGATNTYPLWATVFDNTLKLNPTPGSEIADDVLEVWCFLSAAETTIGDAVAPEIDSYWDKAIEYYATAQFVPEKLSDKYEARYEKEVRQRSGYQHIKHQGVKQIGSAW